MKLQLFFTVVLLTLVFTLAPSLKAHCEIPCGIYGDSTRFTLLKEHITTMEKSMKKIKALSDGKNPTQLYRWIMNKEEHAEKFGNIVTQYFMRQRIKPSKTPGKIGNYDPAYVQKLVLLHELYVYSMKVKQSSEQRNIDTLKMLLERFETLYTKAQKPASKAKVHSHHHTHGNHGHTHSNSHGHDHHDHSHSHDHHH